MLITYEDPVYSSENDYGNQEPVPGNEKGTAFFPRSGHVEAEYDLSAQTLLPLDPAAVLERLARDHAQRGNPGLFRVEETNGLFHIIPTGVVDKQGNVRSVLPILDTKIDMPLTDRSLYDTVKGVCQMVSRSAGISVVIGQMPTNYFLQQHLSIGATNERARDVLVRITRTLDKRLVWIGLTGAGGDYVMNFEVANVVVDYPPGKEIRKKGDFRRP